MTMRWGIVGLGSIVEHQIISALKNAKNTKLSAICDCDRVRVDKFADQYNIDGAYYSYEEMLADPKLDVIYIGTPNHLHAQQAIMAAEAGKHILCEKPMALTVVDCENMIEECRERHVKLAINFQNRFSPAVLTTRRLVADGEVGEIVVVRAQGCHFANELSKAPHYPGAGGWRMNPAQAGAGALMGVGVHYFDLLRFILNSDVEDVIAVCDPQESGVLDDMEYAILKFTNGTRGLVVTGVRVPRSDNGIVIYGIRAKITCKVYLGQDEITVEGDSINTKEINNITDSSIRYTRVIDHLNKCVSEDTEPMSSGSDGLEMARITDAIIESSRTNTAIKIK